MMSSEIDHSSLLSTLIPINRLEYNPSYNITTLPAISSSVL